MEKINLAITKDNHEVVIREGKALPLQEPAKINITGQITAPANYNAGRELDVTKTYVLVNRDNNTISLIINETDYYSGLVVGKLELATDYLKFGINHNKEFSTFALADLIKMNRDCFESKEISMELVKKLKNFEIKLEQVKQAKTNDRADIKAIFEQTVTETNIPTNFIMQMEIYKGQGKQKFEVEIYINAVNHDCSLISPDAKFTEKSTRDTIIEAELVKLKQFVIIEQ